MQFGLIFAYYDLGKPGRTLQSELSGPIAMAAVASSIALLAGWSLVAALPLWIILAARGLTAVLYVRARLRLDYGRPVNRWQPVLWHLLALALIAWMAWAALLPWTAVLAMAVLLIRCIYMLLPQRPRVSVKVIGFSELGLGLFTVLLVAIGYWIG